jgi:hypothetical protein
MNRNLKNNERGFGAVEAILIVVIVVLIGTVGYLVYKDKHKTPAKVVTVTKTVTVTPRSTSSATNPYAGWTSYTSKTAGYTVQYPLSWTIQGFNGSGSAIPSAGLTGNENGILLFYPNSKSNSLGIWITNGTKYETNTTGNGNGWGSSPYSAGTIIKTLSNGMDIWKQTEQNATSQQITNNVGALPGQTPVPDFEVVTSGQFGYKLSNGNYLQIEMGFQYGQGQKTTYTYSQQSNSSELQQAESILTSLKQN